MKDLRILLIVKFEWYRETPCDRVRFSITLNSIFIMLRSQCVDYNLNLS